MRMILDERTFDLENDVSRANIEAKISTLRKQFHLDLPPFYFSITDQTQSDTLYRIKDHEMKQHLSKIAFQSGNWPDVNEYHKAIEKVISEAYSNNSPEKNKILHLIEELKRQNSTEQLMQQLIAFKFSPMFVKIHGLQS